MSDTWGTEFGKLSKIKPISIINFKSVDHGTSGGITIIGTLGSIIGASTFGVMTYLITNTRIEIIYYVIICGFLSSLFDSILGDTIQGKYETDIGEYVESKSHNTKLISGFSCINKAFEATELGLVKQTGKTVKINPRARILIKIIVNYMIKNNNL